MLLNEFLKEHRKVEELRSIISHQESEFCAAIAELKAQVQKVSAQMELNHSTRVMAANE
jgi:hypothetical protein